MPVALVVEDEPEFSDFVISAFERIGFNAFAIEYTGNNGEIVNQSSDAEVLFINLTAQGDELELAQVVLRQWPTIRLILLSAKMGSLHALPPVVFVRKPTTPAVLIAMIEHVALSANHLLGSGIIR